MFHVVDQNMMRRPELAQRIRAEPHASFVLPDAAFVEMCKHADWEGTMRGSLAHLSAVPERVHVAMSYGAVMRLELETMRAVERSELLPRDGTEFARRIMWAFSTRGPDLDKVRSEIEAVRGDVLDEQIDPEAEKALVGGMIASFKSDAGSALINDVRRSGGRWDLVLALVRDIAETTLGRTLVEVHGLGVEDAAGFVTSDPFLLRHHILRIRQVARWIVDLGFESVDPHRILNDRFDHEYVAVGSYFDDVLTRDRRAADALRDLLFLLDEVASAAARREYREAWAGGGPALRG